MKGKHVLLAGLAVGAFFVYNGINAAIDTAKGLRIYVTKFSMPTMENGLLALPITVSIDNNSPNSVPVQSLLVTIERFTDGAWAYIASSRPDLTNVQIKSFATTNLNVVVRSSPLDTVKTIVSQITNFGKNRYRVKVETRIAGAIIPTETEYTV